MSQKTTRRGFDKDDYKFFSDESVNKLKIAQEEVQWLIDRNYKISSIIDLVGGHYQLSSRQRTALKRAISTKFQYEKRKSTMLPIESYKDGCLYIDGFNLIITLEVALSQSLLILGNDGVLRDLAGLRGTYRIIDKTYDALELIGKSFNDLKVPVCKFFLDAPVSNSGRLKSVILEHSNYWKIPVDVELVPSPDTILSKMERVVTGDAIILDECKSWFNLSKKIVDDYITDPWIVSFIQ